jgi:ribosome-associated protein
MWANSARPEYGSAVDDLRISDTISIPADELQWTFSPAGGPGGQHANRSSTRAELRFDVASSRAFDDETRRRLLERFGDNSVLVVAVDTSRSQWQNRQIARQRLRDQLREALRPDPPKRRATKPSRAVRRRRVDDKRWRSRTKSLRKSPGLDD